MAGVDEAGRGPLAGPVVVAAVILDPRAVPKGLADSKKLTAKARERLYGEIIDQSLSLSIVQASCLHIEKLNILGATLWAMREALVSLSIPADEALIDGNRLPSDLPCKARALVGGDALEPAISAASILAKVTRDRLMRRQGLFWPDHGFETHKGYGTRAHLQALHQYGVTPLHRRDFAPVCAMLEGL